MFTAKALAVKDDSVAAVNLFEAESPELEDCTCPLCESVTARVAETFGAFQILKCECDFFYLSPRLTESSMRKYYEDGSYYCGPGAGYQNYSDQEYGLRMTFRTLLKNLNKRGCCGGDLLEIGCGWGYLLDEARAYFPTRWGTEYNREAVLRARRRSERLFLGGLPEIRGEEKKFNCIILNHVIEHIYDPKNFLIELSTLLKPNASIVLATPNINSPIRHIMRKKWPSYKTPEHVTYYSQKTLQRLLHDCGFDKPRKLPYPHAFPLSLIASKFGVRVPKSLGRHCLWVPTTTTCCLARYHG